VKKILCVVMFIALCSFFAMAQGSQAPMITVNHGVTVHRGGDFSPAGAPALCHGKCPFYGGDIDLNDPNAGGFANGNTLLVSDTHVYSALKAPVNAMVTGMLINNTPYPPQGGNPYDPAVATWDVRIGVSEGNCGTSVASGSDKLVHQPSGRNLPWGIEDSAGSLFTSPVPISAGTTYWFNLTPQCTNSGNPDCTGGYFFEENTDGLNGVNAGLQPKYQVYISSSSFGFTCTNLCDLVGQGSGCQGMSYALAGHK
jgi:hypothetical protein